MPANLPSEQNVLDALPTCFGLPPYCVVGNQIWSIAVSGVAFSARGCGHSHLATVSVTLKGPHERVRRARVRLPLHPLLERQYSGARAASVIQHRLPYTDAADVIDVTQADLVEDQDVPASVRRPRA